MTPFTIPNNMYSAIVALKSAKVSPDLLLPWHTFLILQPAVGMESKNPPLQYIGETHVVKRQTPNNDAKISYFEVLCIDNYALSLPNS